MRMNGRKIQCMAAKLRSDQDAIPADEILPLDMNLVRNEADCTLVRCSIQELLPGPIMRALAGLSLAPRIANRRSDSMLLFQILLAYFSLWWNPIFQFLESW